MEKVDSKSRKMFITDSIYNNLTSLSLIQQKEKIIASEPTINNVVPDYCTNPGGMISNCWCMCHMSRHIHWYYYYDIVVSLTQTTLGPAIINIILGDPKSIPILSGVLWYLHSAISAWHSCGWRVEEDGGYYGWRVVGSGGRRWHRQQYIQINVSICGSYIEVVWAGWIQSQVSRYVRSPEVQGAGSVKWNWAECVTMSRGAVSRRWRLSRALDTGHLHTAPRPSLIAPHFSRFVVDKEGAEGRHQEALQGHHWRLCTLFVLEHRLVSSHQYWLVTLGC